MTLHHGSDVFTDSFVLLRVDGVWRIANKTHHRTTCRPVLALVGRCNGQQA
ncbi:nuclear transport factor 2 family protein [Nocardioides humi]|uniref:nuclear transport factor 2 family protein n=1 Tax=Nocardioides humi TaxID=449461 RepID=UPI00112ABC59|nr:nuclear transport factor 2 family protein [Nocardioides humi]